MFARISLTLVLMAGLVHCGPKSDDRPTAANPAPTEYERLKEELTREKPDRSWSRAQLDAYDAKIDRLEPLVPAGDDLGRLFVEGRRFAVASVRFQSAPSIPDLNKEKESRYRRLLGEIKAEQVPALDGSDERLMQFAEKVAEADELRHEVGDRVVDPEIDTRVVKVTVAFERAIRQEKAARKAALAKLKKADADLLVLSAPTRWSSESEKARYANYLEDIQKTIDQAGQLDLSESTDATGQGIKMLLRDLAPRVKAARKALAPKT